jgi:hypothetical protein
MVISLSLSPPSLPSALSSSPLLSCSCTPSPRRRPSRCRSWPAVAQTERAEQGHGKARPASAPSLNGGSTASRGRRGRRRRRSSGRSKDGEAWPASTPSSRRLPSPTPAAAPPTAHPRRRSGGSSARGRSPRNTSGRQRSACRTSRSTMTRRPSASVATRPARRLRRSQACLHLLGSHRCTDEGERSGLPAEEGGAVGRRQRRVARWAGGRGEE